MFTLPSRSISLIQRSFVLLLPGLVMLTKISEMQDSFDGALQSFKQDTAKISNDLQSRRSLISEEFRLAREGAQRDLAAGLKPLEQRLELVRGDVSALRAELREFRRESKVSSTARAKHLSQS